MIVKISHPEVKELWYRNSFYFGYWKFFKSDIDITVVFERANQKLISEITHTHSFFRRYLPVIGELIIYSEHLKQPLLTCVNTYELRRDPHLIEKYNLEKAPNHYEKIIFLHKFLVSNWFKDYIDIQRPEKIEYFMEQIELGPRKAFLDLIDDLGSLLGLDQAQFKQDYLTQMSLKDEHQEFTFPNIIYCLFYNNLCYLKPKTPLDINEQKVLEHTALWELWGCYSYQGSIPLSELKAHFTRITDRLDELTNPEFATSYNELAKQLGFKQ